LTDEGTPVRYELGGPGTPLGPMDFLFHTCPDGHEAHLVSCTIDTGAHFRGPRPGVDHPPLSIADVKEIVHLYKYSPYVHPMACYGLNFTFPCKYVGDPEMSQTAAVMNTEMGSTSVVSAAKVNKVCPLC